MTDPAAVIRLDHVYTQAPSAVWRALTDPALHAKWWAAGDIRAEVGHRFELDMGAWGKQPCEVLEVDPPHRFVYSFTAAWTLTWRLEEEGTGTRVFLEHSGFDLDDKRMADAFNRMRPGWRDVVLARLVAVAARA